MPFKGNRQTRPLPASPDALGGASVLSVGRVTDGHLTVNPTPGRLTFHPHGSHSVTAFIQLYSRPRR
jgi:hypothetical protein